MSKKIQTLINSVSIFNIRINEAFTAGLASAMSFFLLYIHSNVKLRDASALRKSLHQFTYLMKMYVVCTHESPLYEAVLRSIFNIPLFYKRSKRHP